jgi:ATP-dependent Clp protease adaptor protein ClpS
VQGVSRLPAFAALLLRSTPAERIAIQRVEKDEPEEKKDEPWRVLLHNDDYTPMEYVTTVLHDVFKIGWMRATWVMLKAHRGGTAEVAVLPRHEAESRVRVAMARARGDGWPLRLSCEPTG